KEIPTPPLLDSRQETKTAVELAETTGTLVSGRTDPQPAPATRPTRRWAVALGLLAIVVISLLALTRRAPNTEPAPGTNTRSGSSEPAKQPITTPPAETAMHAAP